MNYKKFLVKIVSVLLICSSFKIDAQEAPKNWHLLDQTDDNIPGISLQKAYDLLKKNQKKSSTVIVAVLDSGLDIFHEDLSSILWLNTNEKPDNKIDDDNNGYVDDIHGWNFIGGTDGVSLQAETLESVRLYRQYVKQFEGENRFTIDATEREDFDKFLQYKKEYENGKRELESSIKRNQSEYDFFHKIVPPLQEIMEKRSFSKKELKRKRIKDTDVNNLRNSFLRVLEQNQSKNLTSEKLIKHYEDLSNRMDDLKTRLEFNYSMNFNGRALIGDDINNLSERTYGNNDLSKRSEHGTHVSGIIGAKRDNGIGVKGIADDILIMSIRSIPLGDERDKDVANGIRYAVDNGAKIINMSFGKSYSPNKKNVDEAVKYAKEKGVLIVHAAGNDHKNIDYFHNYPTALLSDGTVVTNWIEVGASSYKPDENLAAKFSNFGKSSVDVFAPGVDIYATIPGNEYDKRSGTSMAAPVVSGIAALLMSYFPELTPEQVIELILESGTDYSINVKLPGSEKLVPFSYLSKSGKVVNAYKAVKLAIEKYSTNKK